MAGTHLSTNNPRFPILGVKAANNSFVYNPVLPQKHSMYPTIWDIPRDSKKE